MSEVFNVSEAKAQLSRLMDAALAGREIILAKRGKPVARLVPLANVVRKRVPGRLQGRVDDCFFEFLPATELDTWQ
jgi:prevent-host-death family protein